MELKDVGEGMCFRTRLTGRVGRVIAHTEDRGVVVAWVDRVGGGTKYLHPGVVVDVTPTPAELVV